MKRIVSFLFIIMCLGLTACGGRKLPSVEEAASMDWEALHQYEGMKLGDFEKAWGKAEVANNQYIWEAPLTGGNKYMIADVENDKVISLISSQPMFVIVSEMEGGHTLGFVHGKEYQINSGMLTQLPSQTFFGKPIEYEVGDYYYFETNGIVMESYPAQISDPYGAVKMGHASAEEIVRIEDEMAAFHIVFEGMEPEEETEGHESAAGELPRLIMVNDIIYYDTGELSTVDGRCGNMDGTIDSSMSGGMGIPTKNNSSNFGVGYGYQYGPEEGMIEVLIDDEWHVFRNYEEIVKSSAVSVIGGADGPTGIVITEIFGEETMDGYQSINMGKAKEFFQTPGGYTIVDVRRADEYAGGHIPGAINIANESIGTDAPAELPDKNQLIFVYCRSGRRSKEASKKLAAIGYENIVECGGILDWTGEIEK